MIDTKKAKQGLEKVRQIVYECLTESPELWKALCKNITNAEKTIEELEERIAIKDEPTRKIFHPNILLFECEGCGDAVEGIDKYCHNCGRRFADDEEGVFIDKDGEQE